VRAAVCTVLASAPFSSARTALLPDILPGDKFVLGSAVGNITYQASQILGFVAGAAIVGVLRPGKTLGIEAVSFGISALIVLFWVKARPSPGGKERRGLRFGRCQRTGSGSFSATAYC
jgi:hypothetical protein